MASGIKLHVDNIIAYGKKGAYYGIVEDVNKIKRNLPLIIRETDIPILMRELQTNDDGIYFVDRFCQLIFCAEMKKHSGAGKLAFFDCKNDLDTALDMYNDFTRDGWIKQPKDEFMSLFQEIQAEYSTMQFAELTTNEV